MKTTTTETFDKDGKVVKRVTVTEDEGAPVWPVYPSPVLPYPTYPPTQVVPYYPPYTITCHTPNIC